MSSLFSCRIMTGNRLTTLPSGNFSVYPDLQVLVLNDNLLTSIPAEGLDSLPQLTNLWVYQWTPLFTARVATSICTSTHISTHIVTYTHTTAYINHAHACLYYIMSLSVYFMNCEM